MHSLNRTTASVAPPPPERVLQFGGGNFLRGFADWIIQVYNDTRDADLGVLVANNSDRRIYSEWQQQDGLFHVLTRGIRQGKTVDEVDLITNVSRVISMDADWSGFLASAEQPDFRYIISNTTEAGIRFSENDRLDSGVPDEFPAKLTAWLYRRFTHFAGVESRGCIVFPLELIVDNGSVLRDLVVKYARHWSLPEAFVAWVQQHCTFCNTLVDRIVPGVGEAEQATTWERLGFRDVAVTQGEPYHLLAIEAPAAVRQELPLDQIGLNIIYTDNLTPYRRSKVAILNGAHTSMVPVGYLSGKETVRETLEDETTGAFVRELLFEEVIPILRLPEVDLERFADDVLDRFRNPFIHHRLLSISLNSVSKFRERVLTSLLAYLEQRGTPPPRMTLAFAALIRFYRGKRAGQPIPLKDDDWAIDFLQRAWAECNSLDELTGRVLGWKRAWGRDLSDLPGLAEELSLALDRIEREGMAEAVELTLTSQTR
ncbi:tagaturonate reductase [Lewinella marina]|uniref:Altronate oxidoreductase n=1 Tax=Neolewinella marina TaxID=438751 RepID=A0A2G0CIR0_9BACT|nr:tagaturonate reductase [Neolewinella marina]NJB84985.1 tagaturonate reductase [Neolewinella marina]PHK99865.1 altronate oxidoreductase [Neolewinella marina]